MKKLIKIKDNSGMTHSMFFQGHPEYSRGMTYIELIVVLSIFSVMAAIVFFNYGEFQAKVDIKNLASDIALKAVQAQKLSLSGTLPPLAQQGQVGPAWKPSYGLYFYPNTNNKTFFYFTDLNQDGNFADTTCSGSGECLERITITKGDYISGLSVFYQDGSTAPLSDLTITFARPNSGATIKSTTSLNPYISYVQINIASPKAATAIIKLYASGRIQVN